MKLGIIGWGAYDTTMNKDLTLPKFKKSDLRKMDDFTKIHVKSVVEAIESQNLIFSADDCSKVSTIHNTYFGPHKSVSQFAKSIILEEPDPSPLLFAHTVTNASLGYVCRRFNFTGKSIAFHNSNSFKYLKNTAKNTPDSGCVVLTHTDECTSEMNHEITNNYNMKFKRQPISSSSTIILSTAQITDWYITDVQSLCLYQNLYYEDVRHETKNSIAIFLKQLVHKYKSLDVIIGSNLTSELEDFEALNSKILAIGYCSTLIKIDPLFSSSVLYKVGACIKSTDWTKVLVLDVGMNMEYTAILLERVI